MGAFDGRSPFLLGGSVLEVGEGTLVLRSALGGGFLLDGALAECAAENGLFDAGAVRLGCD